MTIRERLLFTYAYILSFFLQAKDWIVLTAVNWFTAVANMVQACLAPFNIYLSRKYAFFYAEMAEGKKLVDAEQDSAFQSWSKSLFISNKNLEPEMKALGEVEIEKVSFPGWTYGWYDRYLEAIQVK